MRFLLPLIFLFSVTVFAKNEIVTEDIAPEVKKEEMVSVPEAASLKLESTAVAPDNRAESEIPLNFEAKKSSAGEGGGFFRILFTLSILGVVGGGAYFLLRKYSIPRVAKHQTQIKVLQQHYLGPKKSLAIVRVAGESILIGVTENNISMIKSLSLIDDEVPEEIPENFGKALKTQNTDQDFIESNVQEKALAKVAKNNLNFDNDEEFAISGIKDIVSKRLKGMRSIQ